MAINIVYRHADFLIVDKPAGLSFHSETGAGVVAQLCAQLGVPLYSVHRLDKGTSGLLILALHSEAAARLAALFANHQVEKFYLALSHDKPKQKQGWVKGDMASARGGSYKLLKTSQDPAVSYFISQALGTLAAPAEYAVAEAKTPSCRLFLVKPWTGRTHQIRVALKSMAAPISGDERYGGHCADRLYLHAYALRFTYLNEVIALVLPPVTGTYFQQRAVAESLQDWTTPWNLAWPHYQAPRLPRD